MPYIANPWAQDSAQFGAGLGQSLGQALVQQPQLRYELAMRQQQMQAAQHQAAAEQQYRAQQLGMSTQELNLHKQELIQNQEVHQLELERLKKQTDLAEKGVWKLGETKSGIPYRINTITGDTVPLHEVFNGGTAPGGLGAPMTGGQAAADVAKRISQYAAALGTVNNTQGNNDLSKIDPQLLGVLSNRVYSALSLGPMANPLAGLTNAPATNGLGQSTNGLPGQLQASTNRIGRFIVEPVQ